MVLYQNQQNLIAKGKSQHLSSSGDEEDETPESIFKAVRIMSSHSEDNNWTIWTNMTNKCMLYKVENKLGIYNIIISSNH